MAQRFKTIDRNTPLLLPLDLRYWVAQDDLLHFVIHAVERLPLSAFAVNSKDCGDEQYPPHMMLALLIDCYANGIFKFPAHRAGHLSRRCGALPDWQHPSGS
jgi:transposase